MKVTFTVTDLQAALLEFQQQTDITYQLSDYESTLTLPKTLGKGQLNNVNLRKGALDLFVQNHLLDENLVIAVVGSSPASSPVALKFFVSGPVNGAIQGIKADMSVSSGQYGFVYCADQASQVEFAAGKDICTVEIVMTPQLFQTMLSDDHQLAELHQRFNADVLAPYWEFGRTTPLMAIALQQILQCPYQGATRRLYLESKSLELLTLALERLKTPKPEPKKRRPLKPDDIKLIHQARDILINQIHNPPSLLALARQVGTNRLTLTQGFHTLYGTSPFGYLRDLRLMQARRLLMTSEMSITDIAAAVGYTSRSRFATAFRQKTGINPKAFQLRAWQTAG